MDGLINMCGSFNSSSEVIGLVLENMSVVLAVRKIWFFIISLLIQINFCFCTKICPNAIIFLVKTRIKICCKTFDSGWREIRIPKTRNFTINLSSFFVEMSENMEISRVLSLGNLHIDLKFALVTRYWWIYWFFFSVMQVLLPLTSRKSVR